MNLKKVFSTILLASTATLMLAQTPQNCFWAAGAGNVNTDEGNCVAIDASGNSIVTGDFHGTTIAFGSTTLTNAANGTPDFFLVKYDASGNVSWAKRAGGILDDVGKCVTTDAAGNIYVAGYFAGASVTFGAFTLTNTNLGNFDLFLVKYDASGNVLWAKQAGGMSDEVPNAICIDGSGAVVVTGKFHSATMTMGLLSATNNYTTSPDIFVARWDANGNPKWLKSAGKNLTDVGKSVSSDGGANIYVAGVFMSDTVIFGANTLINTDPGNDNIFVTKYDTAGNVQYAKMFAGPDMDQVNGITADASGNAYITGQFRSDTLHLGSLTLLYGNSYDFFVAKLDASGNPQWAHSAQSGTDEFGFGITNDGSGNVYVSGNYSGASIAFGSTTLVNPGGTKLFIAKYDAGGTALWAIQSTGSGSPSFGGSIAAMGVDNLFLAGTFGGSPFTLGNVNLLSAGTTDVYTAHIYNFTVGVPSTANVSCFGGSDGSANSSVVGGYTPLAYAWSNSQTTANASGLTAGTYSVVVTDANGCAHNASATITEPALLTVAMSQQNVDCSLGQLGSATATPSGGTAAYSYLWNTTATTSSISNLSAGTYSVVVTDANGCTANDSVTITAAPAPVSPICMVTVDSASQYNEIIWDKTGFTNVDSFIVYREIATNNYQPIGVVPYDSLSRFTDTVRTLYFPNTGDPNAGTYRYKLQAVDSCGNYAALSPYHNTIFITNNNGTFTWAQLYTIEGGPNPVSNYVLWRDNLSNGTWIPVNSVAGTQQTVSDPAYATYQATASWRVQTLWSISCTPTLRYASPEAASISTSFSNLIGNNLTTSIHAITMENNILVYPTVGDGTFSIELAETNAATVEVYSLMGEKIYSAALNNKKSTISLQENAKGMYLVHLTTANGTAVRRIVVE